MGKNERLSRDQKRKAKLKKRTARSRKHESLAYTGKKYKTTEFIPTYYRTEIGIYESYVVSDRELVDDEVEAAIERLVNQLRAGSLPPFVDTDVIDVSEGEEENLVIANIRRNWLIMEEKGTLPARDDLIGVLRTILNSIATWRTQSLHSQSYLRYIEGFLKKSGVSVQQVTKDLEPLPAPDEDPLLLIGRPWIAGANDAARIEFADRIEELLRAGEAERVIDVCQQLLGETDDMTVVPFLSELAIRGHRALRIAMG